MRITSADISQRNDLTAEEFAKYLLDKMTERKNEKIRSIAQAFDAGFGL